ncbi:MAG: DNA primase [Elusimicrobiota bacterium]
MSISKQTINKIRDAIDIVDLIKEYVPSLKKSGKDFAGFCPFHSEKSPSFYVSPSKNMFFCFGCKQGGDVFKFLMLIEKLVYTEAVRLLGQKANIKVEFEDEEKVQQRQQVLAVLSDAADFYHKYLLDSSSSSRARQFLAQRGVKPQTLLKFKIGYAPDGNKVCEKALSKYSSEILVKSGVVATSGGNAPYDFMRDRLVFPIYDFTGNVIAFGGRSLKETGAPLYLNTPDSPVYSKSKSLFGFFQARESILKSKKPVLLEGYFDVIICHQEGIANAIAPLGTSLTTEHINFIKRYTDSLTLVFDADESGRQASLRAAELCLSQELNCSIATLPEGFDPDEYILKNGAGSFVSLMDSGVNAVVFKSDVVSAKYNVNKPEEKSKAVKEVLETISKISDKIIRQEMLRYVSQRFGVDETIVTGELVKLFTRGQRLPSDVSDTGGYGIVRNVEEDIICLCVKHPKLLKFVSDDVFEDERCLTVLPYIRKLSDVSKIPAVVDSIDPALQEWFTGIVFEQRQYDSPEDMLDAYLKDLNSLRQREKRKRLESQVLPMLDGKIPYDDAKIKEYQELTKLLKGSG